MSKRIIADKSVANGDAPEEITNKFKISFESRFDANKSVATSDVSEEPRKKVKMTSECYLLSVSSGRQLRSASNGLRKNDKKLQRLRIDGYGYSSLNKKRFMRALRKNSTLRALDVAAFALDENFITGVFDNFLQSNCLDDLVLNPWNVDSSGQGIPQLLEEQLNNSYAIKLEQSGFKDGKDSDEFKQACKDKRAGNYFKFLNQHYRPLTYLQESKSHNAEQDKEQSNYPNLPDELTDKIMEFLVCPRFKRYRPS